MTDPKDKGHIAPVLGFTEPKKCLGNTFWEAGPSFEDTVGRDADKRKEENR